VLICSALSERLLVITTSGFGGFLLPVCIYSQEKSALESLAWMHMKTWIYPFHFSTCDTPNPRYAWNQFFTIWHLGVPFVSNQTLGNSKEIWEKLFWVSVANKYLGKVTEAFQKFQAVLMQWWENRVWGVNYWGVNYPPHLQRKG